MNNLAQLHPVPSEPEPHDPLAELRRGALLSEEAEGSRATTPEERDPHAVTKLEPELRPYQSFLATRSGVPQTMQQVRARLKRTVLFTQEALDVPSDWPKEVDEFPWHCLTEVQIIRLNRAMHERWPCLTTAQTHISFVRALLEHSLHSKLITAEEYLDYCRRMPVKNVPVTTLPGRALDEHEIARMLVASASRKRKFYAARDTAMIAVLVSTGMRAGEVAALRYEHWDQKNETLFLPITKNGRSHLVPLHPFTTEMLKIWIKIRGKDDGPLFKKLHCEGIYGWGLNYQGVHHAIRLVAQAAKIEMSGTHDFRRTVATILLDNNVDLVTVAKILNHTSLNSTARYDRRPIKRAREAVETLPLHDLGRVARLLADKS